MRRTHGLIFGSPKAGTSLMVAALTGYLLYVGLRL
jgi:hypothetical protein